MGHPRLRPVCNNGRLGAAERNGMRQLVQLSTVYNYTDTQSKSLFCGGKIKFKTQDDDTLLVKFDFGICLAAAAAAAAPF